MSCLPGPELQGAAGAEQRGAVGLVQLCKEEAAVEGRARPGLSPSYALRPLNKQKRGKDRPPSSLLSAFGRAAERGCKKH